jgi:hypothetical protein
MPNRATHVVAGSLVGGSYSLYCARTQSPRAMFLETLGGIAGGAPGGAFPDWIDTPDSPNHRGIAHGALAAAGLTYAGENIDKMQSCLRRRATQYSYQSQTAASPAVCLWYGILEILMYILAGATAGFVAGCASHLALDFGTPRSLPLIA